MYGPTAGHNMQGAEPTDVNICMHSSQENKALDLQGSPKQDILISKQQAEQLLSCYNIAFELKM